MAEIKFDRFDGGYSDGGRIYFYQKLHELTPEERKDVIDFIKSQDEYAFNVFKWECSAGFYSDIEVKSPRKHTPEEIKKIKNDLLFCLFEPTFI